LSKVTQF